MVNYSIEAIGGNLLTSSSTAREVSARFNLLQSVQLVADILRKIRKSFVHCDFEHPSLEMSNLTYNEIETIFELQHVRNHENFVYNKFVVS